MKKNIRILFFLGVIVLLCFNLGCGIYWKKNMGEREVTWEKKSNKYFGVFYDTLPCDRCFVPSSSITKKRIIDDRIHYYFDTFKLSVPLSDTLLINLVEKGIINGHHFVSLKPKEWWLRYNDDTERTIDSNWTGYYIALGSTTEVKTTYFPNRIKNNINLYRVFKLYYWHNGLKFIPQRQGFVFQITNNKYKCTQDTISMEKFLKGAVVTDFKNFLLF